MSLSLKEYVEKFLTNPEQSVNIDDEGHEDTQAKVVEKLPGETCKLPGTVSKLRATNAPKLADIDKKYGNVKVSRKKTSQPDPELMKFMYTPNSEDEGSDDEYFKSGRDLKSTKLSDIEDDDEEMSDNSDDSSAMNEENHDNSSTDGNDQLTSEGPLKKRQRKDNDKTKFKAGDLLKFNAEHEMRGSCVKNQIALYNSMFELRILHQKVNCLSNQLPQHDKYQAFLEQNNEKYLTALRDCRKAAKYNITQLDEFQEELLKQFPGTKDMQRKVLELSDPCEDDTQGKRKRTFEELQTALTDRHDAFKPFRDSTLSYWHDKVVQIFNQQNFNNFETSIVQQFKNAISNREKLINRTRVISDTRDNNCQILGKQKPQDQRTILGQEFDAEIYEDSDFYSRLLEEVLKTKSIPLGNETELNKLKKSRKGIKYNEKKRTKQRHLNCEVRSKAQKFAGPMKINTGNHSAIDILHKSLFGSYRN